MGMKIWIDKPKKVGSNWQIRFRNSEKGFKPKYETWPVDEYSERFAKERVKDLKAEVRTGNFDPWKEEKSLTSKPLLSQAIKLFLDHYKKKVSANTYSLTEMVLTQFREEFGGWDPKNDPDKKHIKDYKLETVTRDDIDRYISRHTSNNSSAETYLSKFRIMYAYLKNQKLIASAPNLKGDKVRNKGNGLPEILNEDQVLKLYRKAVKTVSSHKHRVDAESWLIYFYTGMRTEELPHLKVRDVNLDEGRATVGKNNDTKTGSGRVIWLPEECHKSFNFLMEGRKENDYVVDHSRSTLDLKMKSTYYLFGKYMKELFPGNDMPLYNLRHSAGCWMLEQGLSIMFVKNQLGHKTLNQVLTYARLTGSGIEKELSRIGR